MEKRTSLVKLIKIFTDAKVDIRFIGGFVRNALLGLPITDIDLATPLLPNKTIKLLETAGIDCILTGVEYGTVTAKVEGETYQIRFVGRAEKRITEDHLRILRYFRFMANLDFQPASAESYNTCIEHAHLTKSLSGERIWSELRKILSLSSQIKVIEKMINDGITSHFLPQNVSTKYLVRIYELANEHPSLNAIVDQPIVLLGCLLKDKEINIEAIATKLKLSNKELGELSKLLSPDTKMNSKMSKIELNGRVYRNGRRQFLSKLVLSWAMEKEKNNGAKLNDDTWLKLVEKAASVKEKVFPVKGRDLIERGIPEGPQVSDILKSLEDWWVKNGCKADKIACLKRL